MLTPLRYLFERAIPAGNIVIIDAGGQSHHFGNGTGRQTVARIRDRAAEWALLRDPALTLGETYMDGRLEIVSGSIYDFLAAVMKGTARAPASRLLKLHDGIRYTVRRVQQYNPIGRSGRNVKHHYDIDPAIYDLFLDSNRQYSCAYFMPGDDLEAAQKSKMRHIAAKLNLKPGHRVLDIGSGWGGLAAYLASVQQLDVMGITLSDEQLAGSRQRAEAMGLTSRMRFEKQDYRTLDARFDRVVSVGMFEHVGVNHFQAYFEKVRDLLVEDGVALIHTIGRTDGPGYTNPFIAKYIFPGGYFPALSEMMAAVEKSGLIASDVEVLRLHYADTLKAWRERFMARRDEAVARMGEDFCRMWEFYLAGSEAGFRFQGLVVFQLQLVKDVGVLPITRDYMADTEADLRERERMRRVPRQRSA
jgi:cyclopropane-fatty-acyl-phospholipid synthase